MPRCPYSRAERTPHCAHFGPVLRAVRLHRDHTTHALVEMAGISHSTIEAFEAGAHAPRLDSIDRLESSLDVKPVTFGLLASARQ